MLKFPKTRNVMTNRNVDMVRSPVLRKIYGFDGSAVLLVLQGEHDIPGRGSTSAPCYSVGSGFCMFLLNALFSRVHRFLFDQIV